MDWPEYKMSGQINQGLALLWHPDSSRAMNSQYNLEPNPITEGGNMSQYAVYARTKDGHIHRMKNVISGFPHTPQLPYGSLAPYVYEQSLVGFPETMVLWTTRRGPCVGIAPLASPLQN